MSWLRISDELAGTLGPGVIVGPAQVDAALAVMHDIRTDTEPRCQCSSPYHPPSGCAEPARWRARYVHTDGSLCAVEIICDRCHALVKREEDYAGAGVGWTCRRHLAPLVTPLEVTAL